MTGPRPETTPEPLPGAVAELAARLAAIDGVVSVVLGGSRATGAAQAGSDWDLGVYYRGAAPLDPADVRALGHGGIVSALGEWGPIVNGGAWLTVAGTPVDVLFRDLDAVERWHAAARRGEFEILAQNGYLAGAPTYLPVGELAIARALAGAPLPRPEFPAALARRADERWHDRAGLALLFAGQHAGTGDPVACSGQLVNAILCAAHGRLAARRHWVLNEKRLVARAGLDASQALLPPAGATPGQLRTAIGAVAEAIGVRAPAMR